jgi:hypothetical protein
MKEIGIASDSSCSSGSRATGLGVFPRSGLARRGRLNVPVIGVARSLIDDAGLTERREHRRAR